MHAICRTAATLTLLALAAAPAAAQPRTADIEKRGLKMSDFPRLGKLSENVYTFEGIHPPNFTTVSLIVVGRDGVLIADGQGTTRETQMMLDAIKTVTDKPVKWYVVGSDHGDHTGGNSVLPKDITFIVHANSRAIMERDAASVMGQNLKAAADALSKGQPAPTPRPPVIVPPASAVMNTDRQVIDVGGMEVDVLFLGRAHTGGDIVVYLPKERVVITGDLLIEGPSYIGDGFVMDWLQTLEGLRALDFETALPGHGNPFTGKAKIDHFEAYLRDFWAQAKAFHDAGVPVQEAAQKVDMRKQAGNYPTITAPGVLWHGVARVYEELDGKAQ